MKELKNKNAFQQDAYRPLQWPSRGGCLPNGGGVSAQEGVYLGVGGVCLLDGGVCVCLGGCLPGGCLPRGVSAQGDCLPGGVCLEERGVCPGRICLGESARHPLVDRMIDTHKNITLTVTKKDFCEA